MIRLVPLCSLAPDAEVSPPRVRLPGEQSMASLPLTTTASVRIAELSTLNGPDQQSNYQKWYLRMDFLKCVCFG